MCDWERVEAMLTGNEPMTDLTPGSRWLLPVTMEGDGAILIPGGYWHLLDDCYVPTLIPADRITELEDKVAHWRRLYEDASAANSDMQKRNLEQMVKDQPKCP